MFNFFAKDRRPNWYPNARVLRDRWGSPTTAAIPAAEFRPTADSPDSVVNHMRWSLGLM